MEQYLELLDRVIGNSKTLSRIEFEKVYKGNPIKIILNTPIIFNDSIPLYRGRLAEDIRKNEDLSDPATFSYVPHDLNEKGLPKMGRANLKGQSIFYASMSIKTNFKEISKDSSIGDEAFMAKWNLKSNSNLHLYRTIPAWGISEDNDPNGIFTITDPEIINSDLGLYLKRLGYIMMSNEEIGKYLGSSYIANCIYAVNNVVKDSLGNEMPVYYDGIVYPSAVGETGDINIALKPEFVDKNLELECVIKGHIAPDMKSVKFRKIGINEEGRIVWYKPIVDENCISNLVPIFFNLSHESIDVSKGYIIDANGQRIKSQFSAIDYMLHKYRDIIFENLCRLINVKIRNDQTISKASLEQNYNMALEFDLYGWQYVEGEAKTPLCKIRYEFTLKNILKRITNDEI